MAEIQCLRGECKRKEDDSHSLLKAMGRNLALILAAMGSDADFSSGETLLCGECTGCSQVWEPRDRSPYMDQERENGKAGL